MTAKRNVKPWYSGNCNLAKQSYYFPSEIWLVVKYKLPGSHQRHWGSEILCRYFLILGTNVKVKSPYFLCWWLIWRILGSLRLSNQFSNRGPRLRKGFTRFWNWKREQICWGWYFGTKKPFSPFPAPFQFHFGALLPLAN